jgi:hypothetical protein
MAKLAPTVCSILNAVWIRQARRRADELITPRGGAKRWIADARKAGYLGNVA